MTAPRLLAALVFLARALPSASAQTPAFEIASVKPTATSDGSFAFNFPPGGRFSARNLTVNTLLRIAYDVQDYQIAGGPGWTSSAGFDIQAEPAPGAPEPSRSEVLQMLQTLLADRFQLTLRRETRQLPIYTLVVGKSGLRLKPSGTDVGRPKSILGDLATPKMSMASLANILSSI